MVGLGRLGKGFGVVGLAVLSNGLASSAIADSFHFKNGQVIEGTVLKGTLNTLTLRSGGALQLTTISQIDHVVLKLADGSELGGELISWNDGIFEVRSADLVLRVADGELLSDDATITATAAPAQPAENESIETAADTVAMAGPPSFIMRNGDKLVGKILHATGSVLTIRPVGGSALPISRAQIETVNVKTEAGEILGGELISWEDGIYRLQTDDRELLVNLLDSEVTPSASIQVAASEPTEELLDKPVATEIEQADAAALPPTEVEALIVEDIEETTPAEVGAGGPANETAVAALAASVEDAEPIDDVIDGQHLIETLVEAVEEDSGSVVVKFQLDKPAARPLVVLYAATESSAKAGEDFEAKSGVITFATGSSYAEVQVPIIDDDQGEESEKFNLFLSGDPQTIAFSERQIAVTINDND